MSVLAAPGVLAFHHRLARGAGLVVAAVGLALLAAAFRMDTAWFDRHVVVPFYYVRPRALPAVVRLSFAAGGLLALLLAYPVAVWVRTRAGRWSAGGAARVALAVVAALGAGELVLRAVHARSRSRTEPLFHVQVGQPDERLGWRSRPSHTTVRRVGDRQFTYAVNARGERARHETDAPDPSAPTLVVAGESIAAGYGLDYDETFAARCGRELGLQVVNVGDFNYGPDQAHQRLVEALARVPRPAAAVVVFIPAELGRLTRDDRPRLLLDERGELALVPPPSGLLARSQLRELLANGVLYASDSVLARAQASTLALLRASAAAARARGARALFVIPSFGPPRAFDERPEAALLRALFVEPGLPHVVVDLDETLRIPRDGHPNPAGAARLAGAIEAALRS